MPGSASHSPGGVRRGRPTRTSDIWNDSTTRETPAGPKARQTRESGGPADGPRAVRLDVSRDVRDVRGCLRAQNANRFRGYVACDHADLGEPSATCSALGRVGDGGLRPMEAAVGRYRQALPSRRRKR